MDAAKDLSYSVIVRPRQEWGCQLVWLGFVAFLVLLRVWLIGDLWLTALLASPLFLFSGWLLKRGRETWIVFSTTGLVYVDGRHRVEVEYGEVEQVTVCVTAGFDADTRYWILLLMAEAPPAGLNPYLSTDFMRWLALEQPERILPLDVTRFDLASVADMMALFFRHVPHIEVKPHPWPDNLIPSLKASLRKHGLDLEQFPDSHCWKAVG